MATRPLVLRAVHPAPDREVPEYVYDPQRQIATYPAGAPLCPRLDKDWTTIEGSYTDGDGGDNEAYDWEEGCWLRWMFYGRIIRIGVRMQSLSLASGKWPQSVVCL